MENNNLQNAEKLPFDGEKTIKVSLLERTTPGSLVFRPHCHLRLEILRVISGELNVTVNQKTITATNESVIIINSYNMHTAFSGNGGVKCYAIMFDFDKLYNESTMTDNCLVPLKEQIYVLNDYLTDESIIAQVDKIIECYNSNSMQTIGNVYTLMGMFFDKGYFKSNIKVPTNEKFFKIVNFINKNVGVADGHTVDLTIPGLAKRFGYNQSYLCRKFKEYTGFTITNYINLLRLEKAQVLLTTTDRPISLISYRCGFNDLVYFSHCFKKRFGVSPSTFRKKNIAPLNYIP